MKMLTITEEFAEVMSEYIEKTYQIWAAQARFISAEEFKKYLVKQIEIIGSMK